MVLPRHSVNKSLNPKTKKERKVVKGWAGLKEDDLANFDQTIREKFKWPHTPRQFQLDAITSQLLRKDVVVHAGTGFGKTAIAAGPHAHEKARGMVTFVISPLIALQEEQVSELKQSCLGSRMLTCNLKVMTFEHEFGLTATAINGTHGGCTLEIMAVRTRATMC